MFLIVAVRCGRGDRIPAMSSVARRQPRRASAVKARLAMTGRLPQREKSRKTCNAECAACGGSTWECVYMSCYDTDQELCFDCARAWYVASGKYKIQKLLRCFGCNKMVENDALFGILSDEEIKERVATMVALNKDKPLDRSLRKLHNRRALRKCPNCPMVCEKDEGCDHMQCPVCFTHFCYDDGKPYE
jgi:hypothetical protein